MESEYIPCSPTPDCPYSSNKLGCHESVHHLYWPGNEYVGTVEKVFRNLPLNKIVECRRLHDIEHQLDPPEKPDRDEMLRSVIEAEQAGMIALSATKRKAVYGR